MTGTDARPRLRGGADGWRGVIGESFTPRSAARLGRCVVDAVGHGRDRLTVLVTHDGRRGGAAAARTAANAAAASPATGRVLFAPHLPTPTGTDAVRAGLADVALLVTASHNPPSWNGLKAKIAPGVPLPTELECAAEQLLRHAPAGDERAAAAPVELDPGGFVRGHVERVLATARSGPRGRRLRVVVDGLGGIAGGPAARMCSALGWEVHNVDTGADPDFGGLVPDPSLMASRRRGARAVLDRGADLGVVLDGDGDRIYLVDHRGRTVQPAELLALLLDQHARTEVGRCGGVALTVATGMAVRRVAAARGLGISEHPVGFKHLAPLLAAGTADVAGGGVGDLGFGGFGADRDPFVALGLLAGLLHRTGVPLAELLDDLHATFGRPYWFESRLDASATATRLLDAGLGALRAIGLAGSLRAVTLVDGVKFWLDEHQWILLRASSTEGGTRVYGELIGDAEAAGLAARAVDAVRAELAGSG